MLTTAWDRVRLIAKMFFVQKFLNLRSLILFLLFMGIVFAVANGQWQSYTHQQDIRHHSQETDRKSWESNPDKHPHRMAHFGAFAFREQYPLSIFETGLENYVGNVIYLEAHKQNTANFSEASLSTGLMRFGDLHVAMLTYLVLPLFIFFIGHDAITRERELSTLRIIHIQGAEMQEVILGKSIGLFVGAVGFALPSLSILWAIASIPISHPSELYLRIALLTILYLLFLLVVCFWTVFISAWSSSSSQSLLSLLGIWLFCFIVLPKSSEAIGTALHPAPSKLFFKKAIEEEVLTFGDPHNASDPHFTKLKDSLMLAYGVQDIKDLPFNFGGYLAALGERNSSAVYARHQDSLMTIYRQQNSLSRSLSLINPYIAIRELSMALSGTDFEAYDNYLLQAEHYRFNMATYMAELQTQHVDPKNISGGTEGKKNAVSKTEFLRFPPFVYEYYPMHRIIADQVWILIAFGLFVTCSLVIAFASNRLFRIY